MERERGRDGERQTDTKRETERGRERDGEKKVTHIDGISVEAAREREGGLYIEVVRLDELVYGWQSA